jgi:hypothetical protein
MQAPVSVCVPWAMTVPTHSRASRVEEGGRAAHSSNKGRLILGSPGQNENVTDVQDLQLPQRTSLTGTNVNPLGFNARILK